MTTGALCCPPYTASLASQPKELRTFTKSIWRGGEVALDQFLQISHLFEIVLQQNLELYRRCGVYGRIGDAISGSVAPQRRCLAAWHGDKADHQNTKES